MKFFRHFPQTPYQFDINGTQFHTSITDITVRAKIAERLRENVTVFYDYLVTDGERPDTVAYKLYGSVDYTWIILMLNNVMSLFDWPLTNDEFNDFLIEKYGSIEASQAEFVYQTVDGYYVDIDTYNGLAVADRSVPISQYDEELRLNENKRRIKVVPAAFVPALQQELKSLFT